MSIVEFAFSHIMLLASPQNRLGDVAGLVIYAAAVLATIVIFSYILSWVERKVFAKMQGRHGPTKTGKYGLLQNLADFIKLLAKADFVPASPYRLLFGVSLFMMLSASIFLIFLMPVFPGLAATNLGLGMLVVFTLLAFMPMLIFVNGIASGNKFAGMGVQNSILVLASYEIPILIALASAGMLANSYNILAIVSAQSKFWFVLLMPMGFAVFFVGMVAELEMPPFDTQGSGSGLISGWLIDESAPRYAMVVFLGYTRILLGSMIIAILFLGGWNGPVLPPGLWLLIKSFVIALVIVMIRIISTRMRLERILRMSWFILLPLSLLNLIVTYVIFVR